MEEGWKNNERGRKRIAYRKDRRISFTQENDEKLIGGGAQRPSTNPVGEQKWVVGDGRQKKEWWDKGKAGADSLRTAVKSTLQKAEVSKECG